MSKSNKDNDRGGKNIRQEEQQNTKSKELRKDFTKKGRKLTKSLNNSRGKYHLSREDVTRFLTMRTQNKKHETD